MFNNFYAICFVKRFRLLMVITVKNEQLKSIKRSDCGHICSQKLELELKKKELCKNSRKQLKSINKPTFSSIHIKLNCVNSF